MKNFDSVTEEGIPDLESGFQGKAVHKEGRVPLDDVGICGDLGGVGGVDRVATFCQKVAHMLNEPGEVSGQDGVEALNFGDQAFQLGGVKIERQIEIHKSAKNKECLRHLLVLCQCSFLTFILLLKIKCG